MEEKSVYLTRDPTAKSKLTKMKLMARPCAIFEPISKTKSLKRITEGVKIHIVRIKSNFGVQLTKSKQNMLNFILSTIAIQLTNETQNTVLLKWQIND